MGQGLVSNCLVEESNILRFEIKPFSAAGFLAAAATFAVPLESLVPFAFLVRKAERFAFPLVGDQSEEQVGAIGFIIEATLAVDDGQAKLLVAY
jgi:hypothetical protein